jgi:prepilin-type N-terminal cleavage/methylation domain-containing protein
MNVPESSKPDQAGFTLIEALIAMVILAVGLTAIANLMVVAGTSNSVANHATAATNVANQTMELLKSARYDALVPGGTIDADTGTTGECGVTPVTAGYNCDTTKTLADADFRGVGTMHVRWRIWTPVTTGSLTTTYIQVAAESRSLAMGSRSRVLLTTFRTDNQ